VKSLRVRIAWLIRGLLAVGAVGLVFAALGSRPAGVAPTATMVPTAEPTATSEPYVERIVSRVARETPLPYPTATSVPDGLTFVSIVDFAYMPSQVRIHVGQTVVWHNDGRESHDVTGNDDWHSGPIEAPVAYRHTFGFVGTFGYRCSVHLDMQGTIVVVP
jgi:plastocyanin